MEDISDHAVKFDKNIDEIRHGVENHSQSEILTQTQVQTFPPSDSTLSSALIKRPSRSGVKYTEKDIVAESVALDPSSTSSNASSVKNTVNYLSPPSPTKTYITSFGEKITRALGEEEAFFNRLYDQGKSRQKDKDVDAVIVAEVLQKSRVAAKKSVAEQKEYMQRLYSKRANTKVKAEENDDMNSLNEDARRHDSFNKLKPSASEQEKATNRLYERGRKAHSDVVDVQSSDAKLIGSRARVLNASEQGEAMQSLCERGRKKGVDKHDSTAAVSNSVDRPRPRASDQARSTNRLYEGGRRGVVPPTVEDESKSGVSPRGGRSKASGQSTQMDRLNPDGVGGRRNKIETEMTCPNDYQPSRVLSVDPFRPPRPHKQKSSPNKHQDPIEDPNSVYAYNVERYGAKSGSGTGLTAYYEGSDAIVYDIHKKTLQDALEQSQRLIEQQQLQLQELQQQYQGKTPLRHEPGLRVRVGLTASSKSPVKPSPRKRNKNGKKLKSPVKSVVSEAEAETEANYVDYQALDANVATINDERDLAKMISRVLYKCDTALTDSYNSVAVPKRDRAGGKLSENETLQQNRLTRALSSQQYNDSMDEALRNKDLNKLKVLLSDRPMAIPLGTTAVDITMNAEFESVSELQIQSPQHNISANALALVPDSDAELALRYKLAMSEGGYRSLVPQSHVEALECSPIFKDSYGVKALLAPYVNKTYPDPEEISQEVSERLQRENKKDRAMSRRIKEDRRARKAGRVDGDGGSSVSGFFLTAEEESQDDDNDEDGSDSGDSRSDRESEADEGQEKNSKSQAKSKTPQQQQSYRPQREEEREGCDVRVLTPQVPINGDHNNDCDDDGLFHTFPKPPATGMGTGGGKQQHFRKIVVSSSNTSLRKNHRIDHRFEAESGLSESEDGESQRVIEVDRYPPAAKLIHRSVDGKIISEEPESLLKKKKRRKHQKDSESGHELSLSPRKQKGQGSNATADAKAMINDFYQNMARRQSRSDPVEVQSPRVEPASNSRKSKQLNSGPGAHPHHIPYTRPTNIRGAQPDDPLRAAELARRRDEKERERLSKIEYYALQRQLKHEQENQARAELLENRQEALRLQQKDFRAKNGAKRIPTKVQQQRANANANPNKRPPGKPKPKPATKARPLPPKARPTLPVKRPNSIPLRRQPQDDPVRSRQDKAVVAANLNHNLFMMFPPQLLMPQNQNQGQGQDYIAAVASSGPETVSVSSVPHSFPQGFVQPRMPLVEQDHGQSQATHRHQHPQEFDHLEPIQNIQRVSRSLPQELSEPKREQPFQKLRDLYAADEGSKLGEGQGQGQSVLAMSNSAPADPIQHPGMFAYGQGGGRHQSPPQLFSSPGKVLDASNGHSTVDKSLISSRYVSKFQSPSIQEPALAVKMRQQQTGDDSSCSFPESYSFELFCPNEKQPVAPAVTSLAPAVAEEAAHIPVEPVRADSFRKYGNPMLQVQHQAVPYRRSKQTKEPLKSPYIAVQNRPSASNPVQSRYTADDLLAEPIHEEAQ